MSENYIVSARKYRPSTFSAVVGQQALTHTLQTAIASSRLAHAYLFCGPRGVGKTTCARIFAKAINCEHLTPQGEPCNECESCRAFNEQRSYNIVELDAASNNGVDEIRALNDQVRIPPQVGRYRVFIIDEVHMLSTAAFNAFLKTLEEPPEYAVFILATTEKQKIIPTILSRCQIYDFARIKVPDIVQQLQYIARDRGVEAESAALNVIAQKADGAMRDALSIFDQVSASSEGHITYQRALENLNVLDYDYYFRLDEAFLHSDVPQALLIYKDIRDHGFDSQFFINGLAQHIRDLMVASNPQTAVLLEMNADVAQRFVQEAAHFKPAFYYRAMDLCNFCDLNYRAASNKQLMVELTLIKLCQLLSQPVPATGEGPAKMAKIRQPAAASQPATPSAARPQSPTPPLQASQPRASVARKPVVQRHQVQRQAADPAPVSSSAPAHRQQPFTEEQLIEAWKAYVEQHPDQILVTRIMNSMKPKRIDEVTYRLTLAPGQDGFITPSLAEILAFLRSAVNNDMLAIELQVDDSIKPPKVWTGREIVDDIRSRHANLDGLIKTYGLTLA